jgi:hydroxyacylglutathione hydrolase
MEEEKMKNANIIRIPILPMGMINAFLIINDQNCILVDSGLPDTESKVEKALKSNGLTFSDIKLIVVTHAHIDHAGNAKLIRELSKAPILAHEGDLPFLTGQAAMGFCPTGWFGRMFKKTGLITKHYAPFEPDILLKNQEIFDLTLYGIPAIVQYTPGHTEGSISVVLKNKEALVGDLVSSGILLGGIIRKKHAKRPPFEDDPHRVSHELQGMIRSGVEMFHMGHGGPLNAMEVSHHAQNLIKISWSCKKSKGQLVVELS